MGALFLPTLIRFLDSIVTRLLTRPRRMGFMNSANLFQSGSWIKHNLNVVWFLNSELDQFESRAPRKGKATESGEGTWNCQWDIAATSVYDLQALGRSEHGNCRALKENTCCFCMARIPAGTLDLSRVWSLASQLLIRGRLNSIYTVDTAECRSVSQFRRFHSIFSSGLHSLGSNWCVYRHLDT